MNEINEMVYGHAQAKKMLSVLLKRSQDRYYTKCVKGGSEYKDTLKCLMIGSSGTGKTHLIQSFSKLNNFPLICLDATQLMPAGNSEGLNIKQLKKMIDEKCIEYVKRPEYHSVEGVMNQLVIFVDEFDKLGTSFDSSGNWNKHVQSNFLTMIDNKEEFAGISWVFAGAFASVFEEKNRQSNKNSIGFFPSADVEGEYEITDADILKAGIIPEMLGRISLIVQLDVFSREDYKNVLMTLLPKYTLELDEASIEAIVAKAHDSGQGIRSLTRQLEMLSIDIEYKSIKIHP